MAFLDWSNDYSVGVAIFDDEHKKLIATINDLYDSIQKGVDDADLIRTSDAMVEYTLLHCLHEEMYFDDWVYPSAAVHAAAHHKLRDQIFDYRKQICRMDSRGLAEEMLSFLRQWLVHHIQVDDMAYGVFLHDKGLR